MSTVTFETLDLEAAELAFALWSAEDAPTLDDAALLALDIIDAAQAYALDYDHDIGELAAEVYAATGDAEAFDTMCAALPF
jgi:hypothetical protein